MPVIHVELIAGRTQSQKTQIAERLTSAIVEICGTAAADVHVVFSDVSKFDWFVAGTAVGGPDSRTDGSDCS